EDQDLLSRDLLTKGAARGLPTRRPARGGCHRRGPAEEGPVARGAHGRGAVVVAEPRTRRGHAEDRGLSGLRPGAWPCRGWWWGRAEAGGVCVPRPVACVDGQKGCRSSAENRGVCPLSENLVL